MTANFADRLVTKPAGFSNEPSEVNGRYSQFNARVEILADEPGCMILKRKHTCFGWDREATRLSCD